MNFVTLTWFVVGACIVYVVAQDANVYDWLVLQSKRLGIEFRRIWFLISNHPDSPWIRYKIKQNADKIAQEFVKKNENR